VPSCGAEQPSRRRHRTRHKLFAEWTPGTLPELAGGLQEARSFINGVGRPAGIHVHHAARSFTCLSPKRSGLCRGLLQPGQAVLGPPVRKHIRKCLISGSLITLRHLVHHTAACGQWELLAWRGWRLDDVITKDTSSKWSHQKELISIRRGVPLLQHGVHASARSWPGDGTTVSEMDGENVSSPGMSQPFPRRP